MTQKSKGIVTWPEGDKPRERLLRLGPQNMTEPELVAILLRVGYQGTNAVELKNDSEIADPSPENLKKYDYAQAHFERLSEWMIEAKIPTRYQHNWLSPESYNPFFQLLRDEKVRGFRSELVANESDCAR